MYIYSKDHKLDHLTIFQNQKEEEKNMLVTQFIFYHLDVPINYYISEIYCPLRYHCFQSYSAQTHLSGGCALDGIQQI